MEIHTISPYLKLIDLQPPIPGYEKFLGAYLFVGERKAIVDPGPRSVIPNLLSALTELNISRNEIDCIILTHIHIDHAGGASTALQYMPQAKVFAHSRAVRHLIDPTRLWEASVKTLGDLALQCGRIEPVPEDRIAAATDLMTIDLGRGLVLEITTLPDMPLTISASLTERMAFSSPAKQQGSVSTEPSVWPLHRHSSSRRPCLPSTG